MRSLSDLLSAPIELGCVVTIGNFDGMHLGHELLVEKAIEIARREGVQAMALTFNPHPEIVLGHMKTSDRLFCNTQKEAALRHAGIQEVVVASVEEDFLRREAPWFIDQVLVRALKTRGVVVGENFRFGHKRAGDVTLLARELPKRQIQLECLDMKGENGEVISSTRIRQLLGLGRVRDAAKLLGREHVCVGTVIEGKKLGRTIGVSTANLSDTKQMLPKDGVYAVRVGMFGSHKEAKTDFSPFKMVGVANLGVRPTVDGSSHSFEVHVIDPVPTHEVNWYGRTLKVAFAERLRDEMKFDGLPSLKAQIVRDIANAREALC